MDFITGTSLNPLANVEYVRQRGIEGEQKGRQSRLADLASRAYQSSVGEGQDYIARMIKTDPAAGLQYGDKLQGMEDARMRKLVGAARAMRTAIDTRNPTQIESTWQTVRPFVQREFPGQYDERWNANYAATVDKVLSLEPMFQGASSMPTDVRSFEFFTKGLNPEERDRARRVELGIEGRAPTGGFGFKEITGIDGRARMARTNPRTGVLEVYDETSGEFSPLGGAGQLNPGGVSVPAAMPQVAPQEANGMQVVFDDQGQAGIPPQVRAAIEANPNAWAAANDGSQARIGPQQPSSPAARQQVNPALGVSMSPAEKAFAEQNAKNAAEIAAYRQKIPLEAELAGAVEGAKASAKTQAEVSAQQGTRSRDAGQVLSLLAQAEKLLPRATGSGGGALLDTIASAGGYATEGAKATAQLKTIAGQLISKMPRMEGPQSNADVKLYQDMAGDLANPTTPREQRLAALQTIRHLNQKYAGQNSQASPRRAAPVPGTVQGGYRFRGGNPADPNSWERM
ncbi:hypothetical protein [Lysobacter sp. 22409]|uniref:hypothetical protein n=1 Tax=Lysobacter sp. 22409 TaxID=3453917 RepID=UPI003F8583C0